MPIKEPKINSGARIVKTKTGKFRVKYYGRNGEQLAVSEILNSKQSCEKNIQAMRGIFAL